MVTILVGPHKHIIIASASKLTACSPFFKAALDGSFKESEDKEVPLPEETPSTVSLFVHWAHGGKLPKIGQPVRQTPTSLVELYRFANMMRCLDLVRELVTDLHHNMKMMLSGHAKAPKPIHMAPYLDPQSADFVVTKLDDDDGLRRMVMTYFALLPNIWDYLEVRNLDPGSYSADFKEALGTAKMEKIVFKGKRVFPDVEEFLWNGAK